MRKQILLAILIAISTVFFFKANSDTSPDNGINQHTTGQVSCSEFASKVQSRFPESYADFGRDWGNPNKCWFAFTKAPNVEEIQAMESGSLNLELRSGASLSLKNLKEFERKAVAEISARFGMSNVVATLGYDSALRGYVAITYSDKKPDLAGIQSWVKETYSGSPARVEVYFGTLVQSTRLMDIKGN